MKAINLHKELTKLLTDYEYLLNKVREEICAERSLNNPNTAKLNCLSEQEAYYEEVVARTNKGLATLEKHRRNYMAEHDNVNHPSHYTSGKYETIDIIQDKLTPEQFEGFCVGNVIKYITRYGKKNGLEDLEKARWYLDKIIEVKKNG